MSELDLSVIGEVQPSLPLLEIADSEFGLPERNGLYRNKDVGTFKDSLRAPVHRWFKYPAGYSYKFVNANLEQFGIRPGSLVYDPFSGSGTTLIESKLAGVNAYGVEAHAFVHWVASVKLQWDFDLKTLGRDLDGFVARARRFIRERIEIIDTQGVFPDLVYKCYHPEDLRVLYLLRIAIEREECDEHFRDLLKLALTDTLRSSAAAGTGWPYISPRKNDGSKPPKQAFELFRKTCYGMLSDITVVRSRMDEVSNTPRIDNILGDSRMRQQGLADGQVDLALTSPPYLNNYDYADRTRLETYFWGHAQSWADITTLYRDKLMTAATTQIRRSAYDVTHALNDEIKCAAPEVYKVLQSKILQLAELRIKKGGKKDYDLMVALYFNDIFEVLKETHRVLRQKGRFCLVLGDSAPYGIHIATDDFIGLLGQAVGFTTYTYHELRHRGGKWKDNPQRHGLALREGVVSLTK